MSGENENDDTTSFFVTPKRTSSACMSTRSVEEAESATPPLKASGRRISAPVDEQPQAPVASLSETVHRPVDRVVDDRSRTRSYRTVAILSFFFMLSVFSLMFAGYSVYDRYLSDGREESDWGDRGQASFQLDDEDTGLSSVDARGPRKGKGGASTSASIPTRTLKIVMNGEHPFNYVRVKCKKSGFRSGRLAIKGPSVMVEDVPKEACTVDFDGGAGALQKFGGDDLTFTCTFKKSRGLVCR